jgi:hypothetical protein
MAKLKWKAGWYDVAPFPIKVDGKTYKVDPRKDYYHIRLRKPVKGATYRTLDIGKPGRHQLVRMKHKGTWQTQKVLVQKTLKPTSKATKEIIRKALAYQ